MVLAVNPETDTWSTAQYGDAGFLSRNRPVTRSPAAAGPDWLEAFSTEPGSRQLAGRGHRQRHRERVAGVRRARPGPGGQRRLGLIPFSAPT